MTRSESAMPINTLRKLVRLDVDTGNLFWNRRDISYFAYLGDDAMRVWRWWNTKFADKRAFNSKQGAGYRHGSLLGSEKFLAHRVVYALFHGRWPETTIDHIDGNRRNNKPQNLRDVTHIENMRNQQARTSNTSGVNGVSFDKSRGNYVAYIHINGRKINLGRFVSIEDATLARSTADRTYGYHNNHGRAQQ